MLHVTLFSTYFFKDSKGVSSSFLTKIPQRGQQCQSGLFPGLVGGRWLPSFPRTFPFHSVGTNWCVTRRDSRVSCWSFGPSVTLPRRTAASAAPAAGLGVSVRPSTWPSPLRQLERHMQRRWCSRFAHCHVCHSTCTVGTGGISTRCILGLSGCTMNWTWPRTPAAWSPQPPFSRGPWRHVGPPVSTAAWILLCPAALEL